jgi:ribonuclease HI
MNFLQFWRENVHDQWVLETLQVGYKIEFQRVPKMGLIHPKVTENMVHLSVILEEVHALLSKNAIELVPSANKEGFFSSIFLVPKKTGELRPILNLRNLNQFLIKKSFKMETLPAVIRAVQPQDWLVSLDLKDAYFHVPIWPPHRKFLKFQVLNQVYQFKVLPFGLTASPRVFTKMVAPLMAVLRTRGVHIFPYLDDILIKAPTQNLVKTALGLVMQTLIQAGFIINVPKSQMQPTQDLVFIGARFLTHKSLVQVPQGRYATLLDTLKKFQVGRWVTARLFLRLLGLMASMIPVVRNCRLFMRPIQLYLLAFWRMSSRDLEATILIREHLRPHLVWWEDAQHIFQGMPLVPLKPQVTITTDASQTMGWGGYMGTMEVQGMWEPEMVHQHINVMELEAVFRTLQHFQTLLVNKVVLVRSDSATAVAYLNKEGGTKAPTLCMWTYKILTWARTLNITIQAEFVPGVQNDRADRLSRQFANPVEWSLKTQIVRGVFSVLGQPMIDLFATEQNAQMPVYCSRYPEPKAYHVDSLTMDWTGMFGYAYPPISLIPLVLGKIAQLQTTVICILPRWPRRSWFPQVLDLLVQEPLMLPTPWDMLSQRKGQLHHPQPSYLNLMAWKLSGNVSEQKAFRRKLLTHYNNQYENLPPGSIVDCGKYMLIGVLPEGPILAQLRLE